jgi:hypothetical protein
VKYAREVIDLLAAYPRRRFKTKQISNYMDPRADTRQRAVLRTGVWRVLVAPEGCGQVDSTRNEASARVNVEYWWPVMTSVPGKPFQEPSQYVWALAP